VLGTRLLGLANSVWPIRSGHFSLGTFCYDISVHKQLITFEMIEIEMMILAGGMSRLLVLYQLPFEES